jgi:Ca2+:H+ antiporter
MPAHETTPLLSSESDHNGPKFSVESFVKSSKHLLFGSWLNSLILFVPLALLAEHLEYPSKVKFVTSFIAIVPLAKVGW